MAVKNIVTTTAEVSAQVAADTAANAAQTKPTFSLYSEATAIQIGYYGTKMAAVKFNIHEEIQKLLFSDARMLPVADLGVITPKALVVAPGGAPADTRPRSLDGEDSTGRIFAGQRIKIALPPLVAAQFRNGAKRKFATLIFPRLATINAIAIWIMTHVELSKKDDMTYFWSERGRRYRLNLDQDSVDPTYLRAKLGSFSTKFKARYDLADAS